MRYGRYLMDQQKQASVGMPVLSMTSSPVHSKMGSVQKLSVNGTTNNNIGKVLVFEDDALRNETPLRLNTLRKEGHLCDGVVEIDSHSFSVHRVVLASCSSFFLDQFSGGSKQSDSGEVMRGAIPNKHQHLKLNLSGIDTSSVEILINYAYTSRLECEAEQVNSVYRAASLFKMHGAAEACSQFLADNLTVQNCLGTRMFASSCNDLDLVLSANNYIQSHVLDVLERSPEIHLLPTIIVDIVGVEPYGLNSGDEGSLCKLVVNWLERVAEDRSIESLAENPLILYLSSDNTLVDCLEEVADDEINNSDIVKDYKKLGKRKMMTPLKNAKDKSSSVANPHNQQRLIRSSSNPSFNGNSSSCESLLSVGASEWSIVAIKTVADNSFICLAVLNDCLARLPIKFKAQTSNVVTSCLPELHVQCDENIDQAAVAPSESATVIRGGNIAANCGSRSPVENRCSLTPLATMSTARCALGIAVLDSRLVALGGYDRGECLSSVESYDIVTNCWTTLKPMLVARGRFAAAVLDGKLYACGGSNGQADLKSVERYDPSTNSWTLVKDMSCHRTSAGVASTDNRIYVVGGWSGSTGRTSCEVFDLEKGMWSPIADLCQGRSQTTVCAVDNGRIVAVGGCDAWNCTNTVEIYDPTNNKWSYLPSMSVARRGAGVAFFNNKIYVVGGSDGQTSLVSTEIYDLLTGVWSVGPNLSTPRANVGVAVVKRRLFAVGGFSGKAFLNSVEYMSDDREDWCGYCPARDSPGIEVNKNPEKIVLSSALSNREDVDVNEQPQQFNGNGCETETIAIEKLIV